MNDYMNQLKAWMDFYDRSGMGGPRSGGLGMNEANFAGDRMSFAQRMMQQQNPQGVGQARMPDYFGGQNQPAYTPPTATVPNPYPGQMPFQGVIGGTAPPPPPQTGGMNYLQQLFGIGTPRPQPRTAIIGIRG